MPGTPRIHLVGRRNAGKTTMVCALIRELTERGFRVASVKHTHHHQELDTPGKDSHRHRTSGAVATGILAPQMTALFIPSESAVRTDDRYVAFENAFADSDVILVEGDLQTTGTRIEIWRSGLAEPPYAVADAGIKAVISDVQPDGVSCPWWSSLSIADVATSLLQLWSGLKTPGSCAS